MDGTLFGWLLLFGDSSDRMAWLGFFWFVLWIMTQAVMFPAMLLSVFYLGVDWFFGRRLDEIRRAP